MEEPKGRPAELDRHPAAERMEHGERKGGRPKLCNELFGCQHCVPAACPQFLEVVDASIRGTDVVLSLPGAIGIRFMKKVRSHELPALIRIVGQPDGPVLPDRARAGVRATEYLDLVPVEIPDLGHGGEETISDAGRPPGRRLAAAAEDDAGVHRAGRARA